LGAGAGVPGLVCALRGASVVVSTDFPDADLIDNLRWNMTHCSLLPNPQSMHVEGYVWGQYPGKLLKWVEEVETSANGHGQNRLGFDLVLLSDLVFNHSEHEKLIQSVQKTLKRVPDARALAFFTPHRVWLLKEDMNFFELAKKSGFEVKKVYEKAGDKVMFREDKGVSYDNDEMEKRR
jgi:EEF1A N-terminal glycine/lysine methyltransferase